MTVIHGRNGQGKTNLLEAVHVLAAGASHRAASADVMVRDGYERALVTGAVDGSGARVTLEIPQRGKWRAAVNGQVVRRRSEALGKVRAVMFSPDDLDIVKGAPAGRRAFVDVAAVLLRPLVADRQSELERVLRQRSALLRSARSRGVRPVGIDAWNEQLLRHGLAVISDRLTFLSSLAAAVRLVHARLAGADAAMLDLSYRLSWGDVVAPGAAVTEGAFTAALDSAATAERERGVTLVGPHRDDLVIRLGDADARTHASQGESRTIALALRLAVHELAATTGETPTLLLDDVVSELDADRAHALLATIPGHQALITTADDPDRLGLATGAKRVLVDQGRLTER